jgi:hypothetical protein
LYNIHFNLAIGALAGGRRGCATLLRNCPGNREHGYRRPCETPQEDTLQRWMIHCLYFSSASQLDSRASQKYQRQKPTHK